MQGHQNKLKIILGEIRGIGTQQLGKDFVMQNRACFKCGCFDHLAANCGKWVDNGETRPRDNFKNMTPRAVLLKTGIKPTILKRPISIVKPTLNCAQPIRKSFNSAHSNIKRPFEKKSVAKKQIWVPKVSTVGTKVPTVKPTIATNLGNKGKAVKASARWIWKPKQNDSNQCSNANGVSVTFKKYQYIDTQGRLKSVMAWVPKEN
ncbi:hypothetical protein Tco_0751710 [Tanacetum coccineum]|uniref:CCHC-type domain-containing protein n=1 Tax=Tanacetum coccineum TaxID=301880 RepID=A0ABQ4Z4S4_9ASTR